MGLFLQRSHSLDKGLDKVLHTLPSFNCRNKPALAVVQRAEHLQQCAAAGSRLHTVLACTPLLVSSLPSYPKAPPPPNLWRNNLPSKGKSSVVTGSLLESQLAVAKELGMLWLSQPRIGWLLQSHTEPQTSRHRALGRLCARWYCCLCIKTDKQIIKRNFPKQASDAMLQ